MVKCEPLLVADIGGTNARFAITTERDHTCGYVLEDVHVYSTADFATPGDALASYFSSLDYPPPRNACVAVAGPVDNDIVAMTNVHWQFSKSHLQSQFDFARLDVINDFAALACAAACMQQSDLGVIKPGRAEPHSVKAIVGPGTGFGVAALMWTGTRWHPIAGEGGHAGFAPANEIETYILRRLATGDRHVSRETLLCGRGLLTLYTTLGEIRDQPTQFGSPAQITAAASAENPDALCVETLKIFAGVLAATAGDIALTVGARGGVYLGGGIVAQIMTFLEGPVFAERFCQKGAMSAYLTDIPVYHMQHKQPALVGAAAWFDPAPLPRSTGAEGDLCHG